MKIFLDKVNESRDTFLEGPLYQVQWSKMYLINKSDIHLDEFLDRVKGHLYSRSKRFGSNQIERVLL